jgi:hypothetical protein
MFNGLLPAAQRGGSARPSQLACGGASTSDDGGRCGKAFRGVNTWRNGVCFAAGARKGQCRILTRRLREKDVEMGGIGMEHLNHGGAGERLPVSNAVDATWPVRAGLGEPSVPPRTAKYRNASPDCPLLACARFSGGPRKHQLQDEEGDLERAHVGRQPEKQWTSTAVYMMLQSRCLSLAIKLHMAESVLLA